MYCHTCCSIHNLPNAYVIHELIITVDDITMLKKSKFIDKSLFHTKPSSTHDIINHKVHMNSTQNTKSLYHSIIAFVFLRNFPIFWIDECLLLTLASCFKQATIQLCFALFISRYFQTSHSMQLIHDS